MAMSVSLMFGRLGSVLGSYTAALLLDDYCEITFYLSGSILIDTKIKFLYYKYSNQSVLSFTGIGVLSFFIPKIHLKISTIEPDQNNRLSVLSTIGSVRGF